MRIPKSTESQGGAYFHFNDRQISALSRLAEIYPASGAKPSRQEFSAALEMLGPAPTMIDLARQPIKNVVRGVWSHQIAPTRTFKPKDIPAGLALKPVDESGSLHLLANPARLWWQKAYESWPAHSESHAARKAVELASTIGDSRPPNRSRNAERGNSRQSAR